MPLSKINPATNFILMILMMLFVGLSKTVIDYVYIFVFLICLVFILNVNVKKMAKLISYLLFFTIFMFIYNVLLIKEGDVVFTILSLDVHKNAIIISITIATRVMLFAMVSFTFMSIIDSYEISKGLFFVLSPLRLLKINISNLSITLMIALMFVPILFDEFSRITKAQAAKGLEIRAGNIFFRMKHILSLLVPLFISSFNRADTVAQAMDVKLYDQDKKRGNYYPIIFTYNDYLSILLIFVLGCVIFMI